MEAKEIAERYAGRIVHCKCKVDAKSPVLDAAGKMVTEFKGRILGWKKSQGYGMYSSEPSYVCVEVLEPHTTQTKLDKFNKGYIYTHNKNPDGYGRKVLPQDITIPADPGTVYIPRKAKDIPNWPHKCPACGNPAQIFGMNIDCSSPICRHKFKTNSGLDLFLPKDVRERLAMPKTIPTAAKK